MKILTGLNFQPYLKYLSLKPSNSIALREKLIGFRLIGLPVFISYKFIYNIYLKVVKTGFPILIYLTHIGYETPTKIRLIIMLM